MRKADNLPPSCAVVTKSGNLKFLEPSGPVQACNGTALPYFPPTLPSRDGLVPRWREVAVPVLRPVPEAAVKVFSTPDDGCCDTRNV